MKILYPQTNGEIAILMPVENCGLTIKEIAMKDVPAGVPYLICQDSDLPSDWSTSSAWEVDFSKPDGYGIGAEQFFALRGVQV